ncbi:MAG TPA: hypothetical protein VHM48_11380 [Candidatus Limnocylindrales bacterium]|nr:hypothetical protein [Candidatus Limnocylindrales bacterium]
MTTSRLRSTSHRPTARRGTIRAAATAIASAAILLAGVLPTSVAAAGDLTPPTGSVEYWTIDADTQLAEFRFHYTDPESGLDHITVVCDGSAPITIPYSATVLWAIHDGTGGCTTAYGDHDVWIEVFNGDGLGAPGTGFTVTNGPSLHLTVSTAVTGHPITITPVFPSDFTVPAGDGCRWEFRWGTNRALDQGFADETFGGLLFDVRASDGGCGPWTFTLPWVPYRQFDVRVDVFHQDPDGGFVEGPGAQHRFTAAADGTDRRVLTSNLPIAQVLPSTYTPIVGTPVTYTRYLVGGATVCCNANWVARLGNGENPIVWTQNGGSTFTFTPSATGNLLVSWAREGSTGLVLSGYYDPPVRYRDTTAPVATAPRERIRPMAASETVPIAIEWGGTDRGWGIASFQLQRSLNGGGWISVTLPSVTATSVGINGVVGTTLRFRVRAKDKAGNVGSWVYGSTFRVSRVSDASTTIRYSTGWTATARPGAYGGMLHATAGAGAAMSYTFFGRDVAWIASRGPDYGRAKIYLDGAYIGSIDLFATSPEARRIVFARHWTSVGTHTLRIVNVATSGRPWIDVDGFAVLR